MVKVLINTISLRRMACQQLLPSGLNTAVQLVKWLAAIQAQEYGPAKWGIGLRLPHLRENDIEDDLTAGRIIRTHLLRPTWHFVAAEDLRWLLQLTAPRVHAANAFMYRKLELDSRLFARCNDILVKALEGGRRLTRNTLNMEFTRNKIIASGHRLSYIMMQAELEGVICSGAREGRQFTYALLDERVPAQKPRAPDEALAELTRRYFASRGPATVRDYAAWWGLTIASCRRGISLLESNLVKESLDATEYYVVPAGTRSMEIKAFLLPVYDELIMGYKNRDALLQYRNSFIQPPRPQYDSMILYQGQIVGSWRRQDVKGTGIVLSLFREPDKLLASALEDAEKHYIRFFT